MAQTVNDFKFTLDNTCRICLFHHHPVSSVFDTHVASGEPVYQVLNFVFGLDISSEDPLPPNICQPCLWKMTEFYALKTNALSAKSLLLDIVQKLRNLSLRNFSVHNVAAAGPNNEIVTDLATIKIEAEECEVSYSNGRLQELYFANDIGSNIEESTVNSNVDTAEDLGAKDRDVENEKNAVESEISIKGEIEIVEWEMPAECQGREDFLEKYGSGAVMHTDKGNGDFQNELVRSEVMSSPIDIERKRKECGLDVDEMTVRLESKSVPEVKKLVCSRKSKESSVFLCVSNDTFHLKTIANLENENAEKVVYGIRENRIMEKESRPVVESGSSELILSGEEFPVQDRKFVCNVCKKDFRFKGNLVQHIRVHYDDRPFRCRVCSKRFKLGNVRRQHELRHLRDEQNNKEKVEIIEKPYACTTCGKRYSSKKSLINHCYEHTTKYPCTFCGKYLSSKGILERHLRCHTKERPFSCTKCKKSFSLENNLKQHMVTHSAKRPFSCSVCSKSFKKVADKNVHELTHLTKKNH